MLKESLAVKEHFTNLLTSMASSKHFEMPLPGRQSALSIPGSYNDWNAKSAGSSQRSSMKATLGLGTPPHICSSSISLHQVKSREPSNNFTSRRPSLRIVNMPEAALTNSSASDEGSPDSDTPFLNHDSISTPLASLSSSSIGPANARVALNLERSAHFGMAEDDGIGSDGGRTPTCSSFALAINQARRKATPYPSSKRAYFENSDGNHGDEDLGNQDEEDDEDGMNFVDEEEDEDEEESENENLDAQSTILAMKQCLL